MAHTVDATNSLLREANREAPAWLAGLDLVCATAAVLLWVFAPRLGPFPLVLASVPVAIRLLLTGRLSRRTPFDVPLGLFLLTAGLGVWSAYDREAAWARFWLIAGGIVLYYALANATVLDKGRAWLPAFLGAAVAAYFVVTNDWGLYPGETAGLTRLGAMLQASAPAVPGLRLNPSEAGSMLAMLLPIAAWLAWDLWRGYRARGGSGRIWTVVGLAAGILLLVIILAGLALTGSRAAWLAVAAGVYAGTSWLVAGKLSGQRLGRRLGAWIGLLLLGVLLVVAAVPVLGSLGLWETELLNSDSLFLRAGWYRYMLLLAKDYAFVGAGLDNFLMLYASYALLIHVGFFSNAHNLYLGVAIAQGLPGLLTLVWVWGILALVAWRHALHAARKAEGPVSSSTYLAGIAALSVGIVLAHGLLESTLYGVGVFLLFVPLAFALPLEQPPDRTHAAEPHRRRARLLALGAVLALALAVVALGPRSLLAQFHANMGAVYESQTELGLYSWPEWYGQDDVRRAVDLERPVAQFERALSLDPGNSTANRRLGMVELSLGEYEDALRHLQVAYASEDWSVTTRQLLGEALIANGQVDEGRALWTEVNNEQEQLAYRAAWYGHIGEAEREAAIRQAAAR